MKIVVSSDWHVDHVSLGVPRDSEIRRAVEHTVQVAVDEKADVYFFAGDLCDPDSGVSVFRCVEFAIETALRLKAGDIASVWLAGNHDVIEDGSGTTTLTPMRPLHDGANIFVVERPELFFVHTVGRPEPLKVCALPYTATSHRYLPAKFVSELKHEPDIILGHLSIPGVIPGEETVEMPRGREVIYPVQEALASGAKLLIGGHYHRQQVTTDGIHIPGSLARLTFGEQEHEPSYLVIETP